MRERQRADGVGGVAGLVKWTPGAVDDMPRDLRVSLTDAPGKGVYPISGFTYLLIYEDRKEEAKGRAVANKVVWKARTRFVVIWR